MCEYCREGFEVKVEDMSVPSGVRCEMCHSKNNEFWAKLTGRCTVRNQSQFVIFGEGEGVLGKNEFNTLTSNGIMLPEADNTPNYIITGSWTIKTLVEIKGGLSFYIVDGEDNSKEYVIQRFDRTLEGGKNLTINFTIPKEELAEMGKGKFEKVFFRIKNQCCNIENKIRVVNFSFNFIKQDKSGLVEFVPYSLDNELIQSHVLDEKMHNGSLQIIREGRGESGNTWLTIREITNYDNSPTQPLEEKSLESLINMINKKIIRFSFEEEGKKVLVTSQNNQVTAQEVSLNNPDLSVADYKVNPDYLKKAKENMENEKTPEEKALEEKESKSPASDSSNDQNFNKDNEGKTFHSPTERAYEVGNSNEDCEDCHNSSELSKLEGKIDLQKHMLSNQQVLFETKLSKLSSDLSIVQKQKLNAERGELKRMHHELLLQEQYLQKRKDDIDRQSTKVVSQKQTLRSKTMMITKELSGFEKNNLMEQQKKIKSLQDRLA